MSRIADWLKRDFNATDEELTELIFKYGDCEFAEPVSVVAAFAMLKIERLEKRIAELEPKKCKHEFADTRAFWDWDGAKEVEKKYCRKCGRPE